MNERKIGMQIAEHISFAYYAKECTIQMVNTEIELSLALSLRRLSHSYLFANCALFLHKVSTSVRIQQSKPLALLPLQQQPPSTTYYSIFIYK